MGIVRFILKSLILGAFIFSIVTFMPGLPPNVSFTEFRVTEPLPLEGPLRVNTLLNSAERLYSGKVHGPEAFEEYKGELYTSLHGGEVVKFVGDKIVPVIKFGQSCDGFWEETKCGRPLGMKLGPDGFLYVADAYYGLFKVNLKSGGKEQLASVHEPVENKLNKLPNSVDVADDGTVYWTSSSSNFQLCDGVFDMLSDGSGRLLKYNPKTKIHEVLIDNLHFANGVVLSPKEDYVLVAETARSRIHRYYLKGPKKGSRDIFIDGLPGLPDNLKSDGQGGFLVPLVTLRDKNNPVLFQSLGPFPLIRKFFARFIALMEMLFQQIEQIYPNYYSTRAIHWIGHFESLGVVSPKGVIVLQLDIDGKIKHSFHGTDGSAFGISEAHWFNGALYLGSPFNTYVGRVKLSFAEPQQNKQQQQQNKPQQQQQKPSSQQQKPASPPQQKPPQKSPPPQQQQQQKAPSQQQKEPPSHQKQQPPASSKPTSQQQQKPPEPPSQQQQKPPQEKKPQQNPPQQQKPQQSPPQPPSQQKEQSRP